ncbi:hypothetical protein FB446DRAFT_654413 [Lentinula raphanica]|nr:hypothetical protein FB446DRAFT_654413 [Lentinula raphanica]
MSSSRISQDSHLSFPPVPQLKPSVLRPNCTAGQRIFRWTGVNSPPASTIGDPVISFLAGFAAEHSLHDTKSYGAGLRKFHLFCDIFSVKEEDRLPASFSVIHSFALWAASDPQSLPEVAVSTVKSYISGIRAWHFAQGWPDPLSEGDHERLNFSLRGLTKAFRARKRPI